MSQLNFATEKPLDSAEQLAYAREIIQTEGQALLHLADRLDHQFSRAIDLLYNCQGSVMVTGMGKAGLIGQKISATLSSTGTRSHFLHPGEAYHGDLGRIHRSDVVLVLSQSGETEEVIRLLPTLATFKVPVIAITGRPESTLGRGADVVIDLGRMSEVCGLGLAPTTSTTAMLSLGDALALVTSRRRGFKAEDFARFHPGGSLGRKLSKVSDHMRPLSECRVAADQSKVRDVLTTCTKPGRRTGAVMLTAADGTLSGIFTDSDLVRLLEHHQETALDGPVCEVMTKGPAMVQSGARMAEAVTLLARRKISELPVIDSAGRPVGLIDITDIAGLLPDFEALSEAEKRSEQSAAPKPDEPTESVISIPLSTKAPSLSEAEEPAAQVTYKPTFLPFVSGR